jgi:hypothetical protein
MQHSTGRALDDALRWYLPALHEAPDARQSIHLCSAFSLQTEQFSKWTMLRSNQRPLPCEGSVIICWTFLERANSLQTTPFAVTELF